MIENQTNMDFSHKICGVLTSNQPCHGWAKQSHIMLNLGRYRLDLASDNLSNLGHDWLPHGLCTLKIYLKSRNLPSHNMINLSMTWLRLEIQWSSFQSIPSCQFWSLLR